MGGKLVRVTVLNDGETFSNVEGTIIADIFVPDDLDEDENQFIEQALKANDWHSVRDVECRFVLVVGNPFDGMTIQGPFGTAEEATEVAQGFTDVDWWIKEIENP